MKTRSQTADCERRGCQRAQRARASPPKNRATFTSTCDVRRSRAPSLPSSSSQDCASRSLARSLDRSIDHRELSNKIFCALKCKIDHKRRRRARVFALASALAVLMIDAIGTRAPCEGARRRLKATRQVFRLQMRAKSLRVLLANLKRQTAEGGRPHDRANERRSAASNRSYRRSNKSTSTLRGDRVKWRFAASRQNESARIFNLRPHKKFYVQQRALRLFTDWTRM